MSPMAEFAHYPSWIPTGATAFGGRSQPYSSQGTGEILSLARLFPGAIFS
ncbi:hypothetical protein NW870_03010 [Synechococcus sp. R50.1]